MKQFFLNFSMILLCVAAINIYQAGATTCPQATAVSTLPYNAALVCSGTNDITATNATVCAPASSLYYGGQEALLVYTPAANIAVDISILGQSWTGIMVYAGCPTSGGTCVRGISSSLTSKALTNVALTGGTTYYIMVDTWPAPAGPCANAGTNITIGVHVPPPPPAGCLEALAVTCGVTVNGTTVGAPVASNLSTCTTALNTAPGKWYTVVGGGGVITVSLCGSSFDTKVGVFSGTCTGLVCVGGNDDNFAVCGAGNNSHMTFNSVNGTTYYIYVTGFGANSGAFTLNVTGACGVPPPPPIPANDVCTSAIAITCGSSTSGTTVNATADNAPICGTTNTSPGVWYTIVGDGDVFTLSLCGSSFDTKLSVYSGACGSLVCTSGNDDFCGLQSQVEFLSTPGTTYRILVHGFNTATGTFTLNASCAPLCPAPIDAPWTVTAINGAVGSATENCDGSFTVSTTGVGTATADKIHFVHQSLTGNGFVQAEITAFTTFTLGGVQFRDGLTPGARKVALATQLGSRVVHEVRTVTNASHVVRQLAAPKNNYIRIARVGDVFTSSVSADGISWTQINSMTVSGMPSTLRVGFYANSQLAGSGTIDFGSASVSSGLALTSEFDNRSNEVAGFTAMIAFPNPASNELNINMAHLTGEKVQVTVMNALGQVALLQNFDAVNEVERLDINKLSSGVYFLQVNNEAAQKFIVKK